MKSILIGILTSILILLAVAPFASADEAYIIHEEHIYPIEIIEKNDTYYFSLKRIKDILNARLTYDENRNSYIYKYKSKQAVLAPGKSLISVEGRLEFVSHPTIAAGSDLLVPIEFIQKILPLIHFLPVEYNASSRAFIFGENSDPYNLKVNLLSRNEYQRLILQSKKEIPFRITRNDEIIKIRFFRKVILLPFKKKTFTKDIVKEIKFTQESGVTVLEITLARDPDDIKSLRFNNPFRIVLNFMREKERRASSSRRTPDSTSGALNWLESTELKTIVIDPGHGGTNEGAKGPSGLLEKTITLQVAKKLRTIIKQNIPGIKVVLTRESDIDLSLKARTETANHNKADLFISIHCNGSVRHNARGAEVYILSKDASDEASRLLAAMENQGDPSTRPTSTNRTSLTPILWELTQDEYLRESASLADVMQTELNQLLDTPERGVKQAPFRVLTGAIMPAVLVEIAFITNPHEEQKLKDGVYQSAVARALYRSALRFNSIRKRKMETGYSD